MNELNVIDERELLGKEFRIYGTVEEPLFLAKDVAEWIDYCWTNSKQTARKTGQMLETIDEDEKIKNVVVSDSHNVAPTSKARKTQEMWFLTEDGLYEVLMQSRKPIAKLFKKEVKAILKSIRMNGGYIAKQEELTEVELMAKALQVASNVMEQRAKRILELETKVENDAPLVDFATTIAASSDSIDIGKMAKLLKDEGIKVGRNKLFEKLREMKVLMKDNIPYQSFIDRGYFQTTEYTYTTPYGDKLGLKTLVTGKGQIWIVEKMRSCLAA